MRRLRSNQTEKTGGGLPVVLFSLLIAASILVFVVRAADLKILNDIKKPTPEDALPKFNSGQSLSCGWVYERKETDSEKTIKYIYSLPDSKKIEIHFMRADPEKPCFDKTRDFNIAFKAPRPLTPCEEQSIRDTIASIRKHEQKNEPENASVFPGSLLVYVNIIPLLGAYLLLALLIYDILFALRGKQINAHLEHGNDGSNNRVSLKRDIAVFAFAAFVIAAKAKTIFWNSFSYDDIGFLPFFDIDSSNYLSYVTGDTGFPGLPYRALLPLLITSKSLIPLRALGVLFMAGTFAATYITASRYARRSMAAAVSIALISSSFFNYPVQDIRGYAFFIFFGILGIAAFDSSAKKASPAVMFTWAASFAIAAASFPLTIALAAGPAYHYFANLRNNTGPADRRLYAIHFAFLAAEFILVALISVRYTVYHTADIASLADYHKDLKIFIYPLIFAVVLLVAAVCLRKNYRGALMLSASFGLAAPLVFFVLNILKTCGRYYAFSLPAAAVCAAIIVEGLLRRRKKQTGSSADRPTKFITAAVLTVVFFYCCSALLDLRKESEAAFSRSVHRIERFKALFNTDNAPILVYPAVPQYFFYVQKKFNMDIFSRNPGDASLFKIKSQPSRYGDILVSLGNYHTTVVPTDNPERIFNSPVYVVYFESTCSILPDSAYEKCIRTTTPEYRGCSFKMRVESGAVFHCNGIYARRKDTEKNNAPHNSQKKKGAE